MDALPGIGHACGHNLIGISEGVAVACAIKAAMEKHDISGKIILLGTPAEEGGGGKVILLDKGAYKEMDICLMSHLAPGPVGSVSLSGSLAIQQITAEYRGHTPFTMGRKERFRRGRPRIHQCLGTVLAAEALKPTVRVHSIFEGKDWAVNIIPDYVKYKCLVRAPTLKGLKVAVAKVLPCFKAAAWPLDAK
ncbi:Peptidase M20 domain-containing protein 2 [Psilocybe cubensis]|uniref:Peptidase M20 domain-containing protein 2 n=1 Tax=Psilocybe cubensis TaxID=181762 RepID=A0ACB8H1D3_PSICU|nr:Peptidase M20 domain-containing protein 2 [Psilocybe cubensis]KAH9481659.1 Peptidase M20 domain-containing protein 2 [Psilocybe cubensis]